jgi:hypothetical protein
MDHSEAVRSKAAERYLLGEMTGVAREEYEEHFFGCVDCAKEVQAGAVFIDTARDVLGSDGPSATPAAADAKGTARWAWMLRPAFAIPAMALLLMVVVYQNIRTIPHMRSELERSNSAQAVQLFSLLGANSRGGTTPEVTAPRGKEFGFYVDIPPSPQFSSYTIEVQSDSGVTELSAAVSSDEAKQTVPLVIPFSRLTPGKYVLIVRGYDPSQGNAAAEVARYPFTLKFSN